MSSVTFMELIVGARNKREVALIKKTFSDFEVVKTNESISIKAKKLIEQFSKSHGLMIPDAFIAATALEIQIPLSTLNISDFKFIPNLQIL